MTKPQEIVLTPIKEEAGEFDEIERAIIEHLKKEIYLPLLKEIGERPKVLHNSREDLTTAIRRGLVTFHRGEFRGKFSAAISRELRLLGAKWDRRQGSFKLPLGDVPIEVRAAIDASESKFLFMIHRLDRTLEQLLPAKIADKIKLEKYFDSTLWKVDQSFTKSLKGITVAPKLSDKERSTIAESYTHDMKRYIKRFTEEQIEKLRKDIHKSVMSGNRYETLVEQIQKSYGVSHNKAKFLARQETNLMVAAFKQTRYEAAGSKKYIWTCVHMPKDKTPKQHTPGNVRYSHGVLDGTTQTWNDPPITSEPGEPVRRNHPGQDYNCRCIARPIVRFKSEASESD